MDFFKSRDTLKVGSKEYVYYRLEALEKAGLTDSNACRFRSASFSKLPCASATTRRSPTGCEEHRRLEPQGHAARHPLPARARGDAGFHRRAGGGGPGRHARGRRPPGRRPEDQPLVPVDLVIDHSVQVDFFATADALHRNAEIEFQRNRERYEFLKWGQKAFSNFRVVPPMTGIVHQVNLEYLAEVVMTQEEDDRTVVFPDTLVGTDSHTTMINGLGVVGWGVGGIEAEAVMLGQPMDMLLPEVIGFKLHGRLSDGVTATDLVLTVTQMLRKKGVVDKFVEFFGPGLASMSLPDRATIANMAPEYGATMGYFPVDAETLRYMRLTGRPQEVIDRTEAYCRAQGLFRELAPLTPNSPICSSWSWQRLCPRWPGPSARRTGSRCPR